MIHLHLIFELLFSRINLLMSFLSHAIILTLHSHLIIVYNLLRYLLYYFTLTFLNINCPKNAVFSLFLTLNLSTLCWYYICLFSYCNKYHMYYNTAYLSLYLFSHNLLTLSISFPLLLATSLLVSILIV
jgi:hypothetical protein